MKTITLLVYGNVTEENKEDVSISANMMYKYISNHMKESTESAESETFDFNTLYFNDLFKLSNAVTKKDITENIDGILVLYNGNTELRISDVLESVINILEIGNLYNIDNCVVGSKILNKEYSEIQHIPCNKYLLIDTISSDIFIFRPIVQKVKRHICIKTRSNYERNVLGLNIHNQLCGNPDYKNNNILLNIDDTNAVNLYIFDECKDIPELHL